MRLLFYCQHALGMGHFVRSIALADRLADDVDVLFLNGGAVPTGLTFPSRVDRIDMPALGMTETGRLVALDPAYSVDRALEARRALMLDVLRSWQPDVVLIELFPFGRKKFETELLPVLDAAKRADAAGGRAPFVVSSVRDLLITGRVDQQRFDDRARELCDRYFDLVVVHADPLLASFDESFRPSTPLRTPVEHTGFLSRPLSPSFEGPRHGVLVSAGGGLVGEPLYRVAIDAHRANWAAYGLTTTLVAGPFAPVSTLTWLTEAARSTPGLTVLPHVPDLRPLLQQAAVSVSQCGYNTALDIVSTRTPALVVPFGHGRENEQSRRAARLAANGFLQWLPTDELTAERLAAAILETRDFEPAASGLCVDGANETVRLLFQHLALRQQPAVVGGGS